MLLCAKFTSYYVYVLHILINIAGTQETLIQCLTHTHVVYKHAYDVVLQQL